MNKDKYVVYFYNRFCCETQTFHVEAENKEHAQMLFWIKYNKCQMGDCIESIHMYKEPYFYTEDELRLEAEYNKAIRQDKK